MCNALRSKYGLCFNDGIAALKCAVFQNFLLLSLTRDSDVIL